MKSSSFAGVALVLVACTAPFPPQAGKLFNPSPTKPSVGINLSGPADWNTELPFVDLFHFSREWISQQEGKGWGQGPKLEIYAKGWVKRLAPNCWAENFVTSFDRHYPAGDYVVLYEGSGQLTFSNVATVKSASPGRMVLSVDPNRGFFSLQLRKTDPSNPIRNIRVLIPGSEATYRTQPFNPQFLKRWKGGSVLRFMDFMQTNDSKVKTWAERPQLDDASWAQKGIPAEVLIDLSNALKIDAWFCMPHQADNDFVQKFAALAAKRLSPGLRAYVELSNEVWNGQFEQCRYAGAQGLKAGLGEKPWDAGWHWYARRSGQMFDIWTQQFGRERLVRVLAAQAGNVYVAEQILKFEGASKKADALAIAPYFGLSVGNSGTPNADTVASWDYNQLFQHLNSKAIPEAIGWVREHKKLSDQYGLALVAYEGGQHCVGIQGAENNEKLQKLFNSANRHPLMGEAYTRYLQGWKSAGGGLFANFSSVSLDSKWGSWGLLQFGDEPNASSPKFQAVSKFAQSLGQTLGR